MDILAIKTFSIVAVMLIITAVSSKWNRAFETIWEFVGLFVAGIALIIFIPGFSFPTNLLLTLVFAVVIGLLIGPGIRGMMVSYVVRKRLQAEGYTKEQLKKMPSREQGPLYAKIQNEMEESGEHETLAQDWNNILALAIYSTAAITVITAVVVFAFNFDFSFLENILFISLLGLIVVGLLNAFFFKSPLLRLVSAYVGAVVFSLYLLFDFDQLKDAIAAGDVSWGTAINLAINIYLDIVNLFLDLLQILSDSN